MLDQVQISKIAKSRVPSQVTKQDRLASSEQSYFGLLCLAWIASFSILQLRLQGSVAPVFLWAEHGMIIGLSLIHFYVRQCRANRYSERSSVISIGLFLVLATIPFISNGVLRRQYATAGEANELVCLAILQNLTLWLASSSVAIRGKWLSFASSTSLVIFGIVSSDQRGSEFVVACYAFLAAWWLMASYWAPMESDFLPTQSVPILSLRLTTLALVSGITILVVIFLQSQKISVVHLEGFMPTSGGSRWADPTSRKGVGDGEMLVSAKDSASTFGPVESDLFLESNSPSLYDLASEIYGDPIARKRQHSRAIALDTKVLETNKEGEESHNTGREFSVNRIPRAGDPRHLGERGKSRAIAHVIGRTPQHLRLESFDTLDGDRWIQHEDPNSRTIRPNPQLITWSGKPWIHVQTLPEELVYPVRDTLQTKVIQLQSQRVLSSSLTTHVHIDRVDQEDFFDWTTDEQLRMPNHESVPRLTVIHQIVGVFAPHVLLTNGHTLSNLGEPKFCSPLPHPENYLQMPVHYSGAFDLAEQWVAEQQSRSATLLTDWQRVQVIIGRFRKEFRFTSESRPDEADGNGDIVQRTVAAKHGPDYALASTAAVMLRGQGIKCRFAAGFYARPEHQNHVGGHTDVFPEDLHTWVEVYVHGLWVPVEPTSAYLPPIEYRSWSQYLIECSWWTRDYCFTRPVQCVAIGGSGLLCLLFWRRIGLGLIGLLLLPILVLPLRSRVVLIARVLMWQGFLSGKTRWSYLSVTDWLHSLLRSPNRTPESGAGCPFVDAVHFIAYAPRSIQRSWLEGHGQMVSRDCRRFVWIGLQMPFSL